MLKAASRQLDNLVTLTLDGEERRLLLDLPRRDFGTTWRTLLYRDQGRLLLFVTSETLRLLFLHLRERILGLSHLRAVKVRLTFFKIANLGNDHIIKILPLRRPLRSRLLRSGLLNGIRCGLIVL